MISSVSNEQIKKIKRLIKSSKYRYEKRQFVVEGLRSVKEVPKHLIEKVFFTDYMNEHFDYDFDMEKVSDNVMKSICSTKTPQGVVAICNMPKEVSFEPKANDLVVVLDRVSDPGNAGSIIRTCRASGVSFLVFLKGSVDLYNDKVIRSSMGAIFNQNIVTGVDIDYVCSKVKTHIYGAVVDGATTYYENDFSNGACFVMGNEANGISEQVKEKITKKITIPMCRNTESLNVAISTAVLLFEAKRQIDLKGSL